MGAWTNYDTLIIALLKLKDELGNIKIPKYQSLIKFLQVQEIVESEDGRKIHPTNNEIASQINIPITKCNKLLKELREELILSLTENPLEINEVIHQVFILNYYDEIKHWDKSSIIQNDMSFLIRLKLPVTPKIGEVMEFELADENKFNRGTVCEVIHKIKGHTQYIYLYLDPSKNEYYRWMEMKEKYERWERMRKM
jgi:DNA-binding Lrp family transcriptional regulator